MRPSIVFAVAIVAVTSACDGPDPLPDPDPEPTGSTSFDGGTTLIDFDSSSTGALPEEPAVDTPEPAKAVGDELLRSERGVGSVRPVNRR